ncbi:MAG TPA: tetratricopeptide repeat protein, partial [Herpetosiphonaceae bacterium]
RLSILELMGAIAETVNPILIRRALAAYDAGETIDFGPLRLSIAGIQAKGRVLSWERVADIANPPNSTIIRVLETGGKRPWLAIQRANLDSAPVFYELLKHAHGETFSLVRDHAPADEPPEADQPFVRRTWRERLDKAGPWLALALMIVGMFGYRSYRSHYTAPGLIKQADALYRDGQPAEAMAAVEKAIQLDPNSVTAHIQRGSYRQQLRQFDLALADYDRALALDPASPAALLVRGKLHGELGNDAAARADLERYLELGDRYGKRAEVEELLGELDR